MKKKKALKKSETKKKKIVADADYQNDEGKAFNFGGLPNRELKKNLGCG